MNNRKVLVVLEEPFQKIIDKGPSETALKDLSRGIKEIFDLDVHVSITKNTRKEFFGMTICPEVSRINIILNAILVDKRDEEVICELWQETDKWMLEIDSLLFDREFRSKLTAREMVAVLLHEIGHVVYSSSIPVRLNTILRYKALKMKYDTRELTKFNKLMNLFGFTVINACMSKSFSKTDGLRTEKIADAFAVRYGYGTDLDSFIDKLIGSFGNSLVDKSDKELDKEVEVFTTWTINNLEMLKSRKSALRTAIKTEMLRSPSDLIRTHAAMIYNTFFGGPEDKYRSLILESIGLEEDPLVIIKAEAALDHDYDRILKESIFSFISNIGKVKPVNRRDIDMIRIDLDRIETQNDKLYLLDDVYELIDQCNVGLDFIEMGKESKVTQPKAVLQKYKDELTHLRDEIIATRIVEKEYGVFIKYPKGYQG